MNMILNRQGGGPAPAGCKPGVAKKDYFIEIKKLGVLGVLAVNPFLLEILSGLLKKSRLERSDIVPKAGRRRQPAADGGRRQARFLLLTTWLRPPPLASYRAWSARDCNCSMSSPFLNWVRPVRTGSFAFFAPTLKRPTFTAARMRSAIFLPWVRLVCGSTMRNSSPP